MKNLFKTEDWWSLWLGLLVFLLSLGAIFRYDLLGWAAQIREWSDLSKAIVPISKQYAAVPAWASVGLTFVFLLAVVGLGARAMGLPLGRFLTTFGIILVTSYLCLVLGHLGYIATTPDKQKALGIPWSLGITGEAGYLIALLVGLLLANFFPKIAEQLKEGTRAEWFIKTAIVILGASLGFKAAGATSLARAIMFRGVAAIIEAYLIYWALVYWIARRYFRFGREWAAPLASGISICGVSAAIATGAAIRARPIVPIMVSSLVVVFAAIELVLLPFAAKMFLAHEPMVAGAWMGLAVKTDGAATASGAITDALIRTKVLAETGVRYEKDWILMTTTTVKVFIDVFIGIWAFILALVWTYGIERRKGEKVPFATLWERFPKFVLGYAVTFGVCLFLALAARGSAPKLAALKLATDEGNVFRLMFFAVTFFSIGLTSNFRKFWEQGIGRLAMVYVVSLFGFVIWIGLAISWIFFHGARPPLAIG